MKEYVVGFIYSPDKTKVALISKNSPEWQKGLINGIGGKVEDIDSSIHAAMARECEEESGIKSSPDEWKHFCSIKSNNMCDIHFFCLTTDQIDSAKTTTDEEIGIYEIANLPINVMYNLNWLISMSLDNELDFKTPIQFTEQRKVSQDYIDRCCN